MARSDFFDELGAVTYNEFKLLTTMGGSPMTAQALSTVAISLMGSSPSPGDVDYS